ncbi:hypothetical protein B0T21DRAFT_353614 [Apiosordaria backusii]|uniref:Zn(2)-C6 fungal-type domain-containing protein n=1 Tax=Apiosordaria backusii TaxID=314023 RepID=A0AA39ZPW2_9PEZI|nr:hypothetical protein B0T21DRAFT_353614 [Apiosordaria backusii]
MPNLDDSSPSVESPPPAPVSNDNATTTGAALPKRRGAPNRTIDGGLPACVKCHGFKMRCIRQPNQTDCNRCINAKTKCVPREPGSVGRPRLPRPPGWKRSHYKKGRRLGDQPIPSASATADPETPSPSAEVSPPESTSPAKHSAPARYGGPLIGLAGYNALLPNFDDLPSGARTTAAGTPGNLYTTSTFRAPEQPQPQPQPQLQLHPLLPPIQSSQPQPPPKPVASVPQDEDAVEQLTRLQLEIYQHHNAAKKNEPAARRKQPASTTTTSTEPVSINTEWIKPLFQSASLFLTILSHRPFLTDTATFLMIISIYTRLLQTFDILAGLIQAYILHPHNDTNQDHRDFQRGLRKSVQITIGGVEVPISFEETSLQAELVAQQGVLSLINKIGGLLGGLLVGDQGQEDDQGVVEKGALEGVRRLERGVRGRFTQMVV